MYKRQVDVLAYRKVQNNLIKETKCFTKENVGLSEMSQQQRTEIVEGLVKLREMCIRDRCIGLRPWSAPSWRTCVLRHGRSHVC